MCQHHISTNSDLTLATVPITSPWGIVVENNGKLVGFQRDLKIDNVGLLTVNGARPNLFRFMYY